MFPALAVYFDVSYAQLGLLMGLYALTFGLFQLPAGHLVDRYGAKPILVAGLLVHGIAFALLASAPTYAVLLGLALVAGVGQSVFHPADYAILSAAFTVERSGKPYSLHTFSGFAGSAIAPVAIAALYQTFGWQVALATSGLAGVMLAPVLAWRLRVPMVNPARTSAASDGKLTSRRTSLFSQALVLMFVFYVFAAMATSGIQTFLPSSLTELYRVPLSTANTALTVYLSALAAGVLFGGALSNRVSRHARAVGTMFAGSMLLMLLLAVARPPVWLLFPIFAVAGVLHGAVLPSRDKMVREASPEEATGRSFAFVSAGLSLGSLTAPLILGFVLDAGQPHLVFWIISGFMLMAVLTTLAPKRAV